MNNNELARELVALAGKLVEGDGLETKREEVNYFLKAINHLAKQQLKLAWEHEPEKVETALKEMEEHIAKVRELLKA